MAPTIITLLYPTSTIKPFDGKYYTTSHMPLVQKSWSSKGLISWAVAELPADSGYAMQCIMWWESAEAFGAAVQSEEGKVVMADVANYSAERPKSFVGTEIAKS